MSHTVGDIHGFVMNAAPVEGEYQLISGFPPKPLTDPSATVEAAGLKNAAITQKIVWSKNMNVSEMILYYSALQ